MGLGAMRCVVGALFCSLFFGVVDVCAQTDLYVRGAGRLIPLAVQTLCIEGEEGGPEERVPSTIAKDLDV